LLDRLDLVVKVDRVKKSQLLGGGSYESSQIVRQRVAKARVIQAERFKNEEISTNNEMNNKHIEKYCQLNQETKKLMEQAINNLKLSARAYMRVLKVGRTIADMDESKGIETKHIAEALQYRS
jgi:magnesium chelatase family protein